MIKVFGRILLFVISIIITRLRHPRGKIKEVVNVKYPLYKKAS